MGKHKVGKFFSKHNGMLKAMLITAPVLFVGGFVATMGVGVSKIYNAKNTFETYRNSDKVYEVIADDLEAKNDLLLKGKITYEDYVKEVKNAKSTVAEEIYRDDEGYNKAIQDKNVGLGILGTLMAFAFPIGISVNSAIFNKNVINRVNKKYGEEKEIDET